ncbi:uncharacterized protein LOC111342282 isoform X2 [Stylophora pistillata]|uniref:uncharacterized protein LOC111342282 isoform X2 n=1 Tax=Stylophora pistillata TaxID=50429 RepID=UPI000C050650|nr:uncharacterized protein LOC111342282 isoform X2 [Stylophora pistillata]
MGGREFDPDQDKGPLEDYGVTHGCALRVTRQPNTAPDDSTGFDWDVFPQPAFASIGPRNHSFKHACQGLREKVYEDQRLACGFSGDDVRILVGASHSVDVIERDPAWRSGGTTLQGHSTQQFTTAEPIKVDHSRKVELVLRLVARDGEEDLVFPEGECKPLSTLTPPAVQE